MEGDGLTESHGSLQHGEAEIEAIPFSPYALRFCTDLAKIFGLLCVFGVKLLHDDEFAKFEAGGNDLLAEAGEERTCRFGRSF